MLLIAAGRIWRHFLACCFLQMLLIAGGLSLLADEGHGSVQFGSVWFSSVQFSSVEFSSVQFGSVRP